MGVYFDKILGKLRDDSGGGTVVLPGSFYKVLTYVASANQTNFIDALIATKVVSFVMVGNVTLTYNPDDYTISGSVLTLASPVRAGAIVKIILENP